MLKDISTIQKNIYLFLFSDDYLNWKVISISDDFKNLIDIFIPNYLKTLGITSQKEQKQIISGLLSNSMESIVYINSFFKIKKLQTNTILDDKIIFIPSELDVEEESLI